MESFVLSETLKYLYLLFDESSATHAAVASGKVFTTEGHLVRMPSDLRPAPDPIKTSRRRQEFSGAVYQCLPHRPQTLGGLVVGVRQRDDYDYAAMLVDMPLVAESDGMAGAGLCTLPVPSPYHFEMSLSANDSHAPNPKQQIRRVNSGLVIDDVRGLQARVTRTQDGTGLRVSSVGPLRVRPGQSVVLADASVSRRFPVSAGSQGATTNAAADARAMLEDAIEHAMRPIEAIVRAWTQQEGNAVMILESVATTGLFGQPVSWPDHEEEHTPSPLSQPVTIARPMDDHGFGCHGAFYAPAATPFIAVVRRGGCTFFEKLLVAAQHGALAAIVTGDDDLGLRPSADEGEPLHLLDEASILYLPKTAGDVLHLLLDAGQDLLISVQPSPHSANEDITTLLERLARLEQQALPNAMDATEDESSDAKPREGSVPMFHIGGLPIVNLYMD